MAKKDVSAIVSGMGVGLSILNSLVGKARKRGLGEEVIHRLATPEGDQLLDKLVDLMAEADGKTGSSFKVTVNYDHELERMIEDGQYNWADSDINARSFCMEGKGNVELTIELVHFNRVMESDEVQKELDKQGLRPATLPELLAFGSKYPDEQRRFRIVALGSVWRRLFNSNGNVPCLQSNSSKRSLELDWLDDRWPARYRFAAVRK